MKQKSKLSPLASFIDIKPRAKIEENTHICNTETSKISSGIKKVISEKSLETTSSFEIDKVRDLLKSESQKTRTKLFTNKITRDVSHLRDKLKIPELNLKQISNFDWPIDLKQVKNLLENSDYRGFNSALSPRSWISPVVCKKEQCNRIAIGSVRSPNRLTIRNLESEMVSRCNSPSDTIEKMYLGNPTGRQDIGNLRK